MSDARHLVLGGSHGIGYAYAKVRAREGGELVLVGRHPRDLGRARKCLLAIGASTVDIYEGDLVAVDFRTRLRRDLDLSSFQSILVGGPSPPAGTMDETTYDDFVRAIEIVLLYPFEFLEWGLRRAVRTGGEVFVIGSSASLEPLCEHRFFLSALLRRSLDQLIACLEEQYATAGKQLTIWRPKVIMTRLANRFARRLTEDSRPSALREALARHFSAPVQDPDQFVAESLERGR